MNCQYCNKSSPSKTSLTQHEIRCPSNVNRIIPARDGRAGGQANKLNAQKKYNASPKYCVNCSQLLTYEQRKNTFCSKGCAGTYNNLNSSVDRKRGPTPKVKVPKEKLPYSTLYKCVCKTCGLVWRGRSSKQYCDDHVDNYSHCRRAQFWFTFALSDYPELFDFNLLKKHGMRSNDNINGVVRDHRVSVADAIKYNYDPRYIKHPLNCELLLNADNAKKFKRSSLTYEELVKLVDDYEKKLLTIG